MGKTAMKYDDLLAWGSRAKKERGGSAIAPAKKKGKNGEEAERDMQKVGDKLKLTKRSGLLFKDGDVVDVLFMLDLLTKTKRELGNDSPMKSYDETTMLDDESRRCKAALAGSFLISIGYHSAIEVKPTIWAYLGKGAIGVEPKIFSLRGPPSLQRQCDLNATRDMNPLIKGCTA